MIVRILGRSNSAVLGGSWSVKYEIVERSMEIVGEGNEINVENSTWIYACCV